MTVTSPGTGHSHSIINGPAKDINGAGFAKVAGGNTVKNTLFRVGSATLSTIAVASEGKGHRIKAPLLNVIPAQAGIYKNQQVMDSLLRGNDEIQVDQRFLNSDFPTTGFGTLASLREKNKVPMFTQTPFSGHR